MSDLAPLLLPPAPLPRHLYGTRAALFYLLRAPAGPEAIAPATPSPGTPPRPAPPRPARVVPLAVAPVRPAFRDLLQSDSFDFRSAADPG